MLRQIVRGVLFIVVVATLVGCAGAPSPEAGPTPEGNVQDLITEAKTALDSQNVSLAVQKLEQAIAIDSNSVEAHFVLGNAYTQNNQLDKAEELFTRAIEIDPNHTDARSNLGVVLYRQQKFPQAADAFRKAIELEPNDADVQYNLGGVLAAQGNFTEAEQHFLRARELDPNPPQVYLGLGSIYKEQGRKQEAIDNLRIYLEKASDPTWRQQAEQMLKELEQ